MGQQESQLKVLTICLFTLCFQKLCCNNNFCNFDSNIENQTEISKSQDLKKAISPQKHHQILGNQLNYANDRLIVVSAQDKTSRTEMNCASGQGTALYTYSKDQQSQLEILSDQNKRVQLDIFSQAKPDAEWFKLRQQLELALKSAPKLHLLITSSATLQKGEEIIISTLGLESHRSLRTQPINNLPGYGKNQKLNDVENAGEVDLRDGVVYFGCKKSVKLNQTNLDQESTTIKRIVNDFVIPTKNEQTSEQHRGRHFQVQFDVQSHAYFIRDLGVGYGVFVRQEQPFVLKDNMLINMGEAYIVVNVFSGPLSHDQDIMDSLDDHKQNMIHLPPDYEQNKDDDDGTSRLKIKIFGGPSAGEVYFFKACSQVLLIGRTPACDIKINDKLLSKVQSSVRYAANVDSWVLNDGYQGKLSTNGTWLYLNEDYQMCTGMVFKANQTIFTVSLQ